MSQVPEASIAASETLLVVENETAIRALVKMALERHGYAVLSAESGSEALSLAADNQGPIDLLITDVVMPDLRGPDLARRLVSDVAPAALDAAQRVPGDLPQLTGVVRVVSDAVLWEDLLGGKADPFPGMTLP